MHHALIKGGEDADERRAGKEPAKRGGRWLARVTCEESWEFGSQFGGLAEKGLEAWVGVLGRGRAGGRGGREGALGRELVEIG